MLRLMALPAVPNVLFGVAVHVARVRQALIFLTGLQLAFAALLLALSLLLRPRWGLTGVGIAWLATASALALTGTAPPLAVRRATPALSRRLRRLAVTPFGPSAGLHLSDFSTVSGAGGCRRHTGQWAVWDVSSRTVPLPSTCRAGKASERHVPRGSRRRRHACGSRARRAGRRRETSGMGQAGRAGAVATALTTAQPRPTGPGILPP
ncbi:hypothetical protein AB0442_36345 [Kitasatospora sp. NPDC085895]|uniref:hypothetical protein n=1 Tax=Kitasatospora sp. NPDC085895 TaxID=3155057 RepID=UPI00344F4658